MEHAGRACDAPLDICMTFNNTAASLIRHGYARAVDAAEGLALLDEARSRNLVQFGENVRNRVSFICNCCGCCCEAMIAQRRFGLLHPVHTTNFLPAVDGATCTGCGACAAACPVEAMTLVSTNDPAHPKKKRAKVDVTIAWDAGYASGCARPGASLETRPGGHHAPRFDHKARDGQSSAASSRPHLRQPGSFDHRACRVLASSCGFRPSSRPLRRDK